MGAAYEIPPEINVISTKLTYRFVGTCKCRYHLCPSTSVGSVLPLPLSREGDAFLGKGLNPAGNPRRAYLRGDELSILCQQHVKDCIFWATQTCVINLGLRQQEASTLNLEGEIAMMTLHTPTLILIQIVLKG